MAARCLLVLTVLLVWAGCASPGSPVVSERAASSGRPSATSSRPARAAAGTHVVKRGDTLYSIAWRYGVDMKALARNNGLRPPYTIYPGQRLRIGARGAARKAPRPAVASTPRRPSPAAKPSKAKPAPSRAPAPSTARSPANLVWQWPASSPVVREFSKASNGIDFEMKPGARVSAAAAGEVVYAGSGLGGYERLVIVKHNDKYLSAYSLNQPFAVREGQRLKGGERIARIGKGTTKMRMLHFEIRRDGNPVSPRSLLR